MNASLELRRIALRVPDLGRSIGFYADRVGFVVQHRDAASAMLGTSADSDVFLELHEDRNAVAPGPDTAGLFHVALLFPTRSSLGGWLRHAAATDVAFDGFSDHGVSEALYFSDLDGNGLEFYVDRPRDVWPFANGEVAMVTRPLDVASLLAVGVEGDPPLAGARWGHVHLRVTNLDRSEQFYTSQLGVAVTQRSYPGARFLAADGYHHHLGLNIWQHPRQPLPPRALGLERIVFARADARQVSDLLDPDGIPLRVESLARGSL